jgi:hypothetical protein
LGSHHEPESSHASDVIFCRGCSCGRGALARRLGARLARRRGGRILTLYAEDAYFQSHPFRQPQAPGDYILWALSEEESAECEFEEPIVDGDRAAVEWSATTRLKDGGTEKLAGISLLRFDDDGLVVEQRDFWAGA